MSTVVRMPEVLTGMTEAILLAWHVAVGDEVSVGQPLVEVETEKAVVEYQSEEAGTVARFLVELGQPVDVGEPILVLEQAGAPPEAPAPTGDPAPGPAPTATPAPAPAAELGPAQAHRATSSPASVERTFTSPIVRRLAREHDLDLSGVVGTGPHARIVRRDIERLIAAGRADGAPPAQAALVEEQAAPVAEAARLPVSVGYEEIPHSAMRRAIARRLTESKASVPHFYLDATCRVDALLALRREVNALPGGGVTVNDLVVKAVAGAFLDVPEANAIWTPDAIRRFHTVDIAIAVALERGLVTPVLRDVGSRSVSDVGRTSRDLVERARAGRLQQHELEGGVLTISNLGMYGIEGFAAIINPPHAGILSVGAATKRPVVTGEQIEIATVMSVTLSGDHRAMDGALGAQWLAAFVRRVENPLSIIA